MRNKHTNEIQHRRAKAYEIGETALLVVLMASVIIVTLVNYFT